MRTIVLTIILVALAAITASASPLVNIEGDKPNKHIVLKSDGASVEAIVKALGERYGFKVETVGAPEARVLSGVFRGDLERVLRRVLSRESFVVIRDPEPYEGFDFAPPPKRRPHYIRVVKIIGGGGNRVFVHQPPAQAPRPPRSVSKRWKQYNETQRPTRPQPAAPPVGNGNRYMGSES